MPPNSSFEHSWLLFVYYGAAKVTPCAPKGGTKRPQASYIDPVFRSFFYNFFSSGRKCAP